MKYGFVKVAAVTPKIKVNDFKYNAAAIVKAIERMKEQNVEIAVFPELCVTGYTAMDLFFTASLIDGAAAAVNEIARKVPRGMMVFVGAPIADGGRLYNCAVAMTDGKVVGIVPKTELPDYGEFYETRYFTPAFDGVKHNAKFNAPMGNIIFSCKEFDALKIACEICEDMWADVPKSADACRFGATVVCNLSASDEVIGKAEYRRTLITSASGRQHCAYIYADAGEGESTTDVVFSGHNIVAENGGIIKESEPFGDGEAVTEIDVERLIVERRKVGMKEPVHSYEVVEFSLDSGIELTRPVEKYPFVPSGSIESRAELILTMQSRALKSRMDSVGAKTAVIGISGGLDSTLALIVCRRALEPENICAVTMPAFGTSKTTFDNAHKLCASLGVKLKEIDIKATATSHLSDIEHDKKDVVYENAQARIRTMTLFDLANKTNGIVVGTGDLSELALGWATYNGDHMSSYGVNAGVPKTLVKYLVGYEANRKGGEVKDVLDAILSTDISPELLPPEDGKIAQKTEEIIGKYDLHDFIMYYYVRYGFTREKIAFLLGCAFPHVPEKERAKTLDTFFKRFFASQFKRSCLPDGVKIGSVSFSPRSDFRMPSDSKPND